MLKSALKTYTNSGGKGTGTLDVAEAIAQMCYKDLILFKTCIMDLIIALT